MRLWFRRVRTTWKPLRRGRLWFPGRPRLSPPEEWAREKEGVISSSEDLRRP